MQEEVDKLCEIHGMKFVLEQTPAETTAYRFARLDLKHFSPLPGRYVRGDLAKGEIYYTNSTHLHPAAPVDPADAGQDGGALPPLLPGGGRHPHRAGGRRAPGSGPRRTSSSGRSARRQNNQIVFSPEFTSCARCDATSRGLLQQCPHCGSEEVDGLARITQYFSRVSGWNRGKRAELRDRNRNEDVFPHLKPHPPAQTALRI